MITLLPVSRYRVRYQVASGRPYSFFERFVLEAILDGRSSLDDLEKSFRVHRRALIEAIITLIQAGWIALDRDTHALLSTAAGRSALGAKAQLPRNIVVRDQADFIIGERVEGQLAKGTEVTFRSRTELRGYLPRSAVLKSRDLPHPFEPGVIVPYLRVAELEWIRSCGPVDIVRDGADYAVVDVDTSSGAITGIPSKWVPLLRSELQDRARTKERELIGAGAPYQSDTALEKLIRRELEALDRTSRDPDEWVLDAGSEHVIVGADHFALLQSWIETVKSYLCVIAGPLSYSRIDHLQSLIRAALERGVIFDILWSTNGEDGIEEHGRAVELLLKIGRDALTQGSRGRLTIATRSAGTNARILFGDISDTFEAVVGSYCWLADSETSPVGDVSLSFRERRPVARIGRLVADIAASDEHLSRGIGLTRLRYATADLDRQSVEALEETAELNQMVPLATPILDPPDRSLPYESIRARIVVGRQNNAILSVIGREAQRRFVVASHRWGPYSEGTLSTLISTLKSGCGRVEAHYGESNDLGRDSLELAGTFEKLGGVIRHNVGSRARIAVVDDDIAAVSSCDWLCPDFDRRLATASEIGFVLKGSGVGPALLQRVGLRESESPRPLDADYIIGFRIARLRSVEKLEWKLNREVATGWHVLVGDNGAGKTSILRALGLALIGSDNAQKLRQNWSTWIRGRDQTAEVEVSIQRVSGLDMDGSTVEPTSIKISWERGTNGVDLVSTSNCPNPVLSLGYGPFRRFSGGDPDYEKELAAFPDLARHVSLFDERSALTETLAWLRNLRFKSLESDQESAFLLDRVTKLVNGSALLPAGIILAQVNSDSVVFSDQYGYEHGIEDLSDGYRSVLSLVFDIVRQLAIAFGAARLFDTDQQDVVIAPAIILIDEIDAHLHPSWQRNVGQWFCKHFPRVQFILTTHSPLICQAAEMGSVYRLPDPSSENDTGEMLVGPALARLVYGNVLDAYGSGAFGFDITRSESSKALLHRLAILNRKELTIGLSENEQSEQEVLRAALPSSAYLTGSETGEQ